MANINKIVGEIEEMVRNLASKGYNPTHIGKQVGLAKDTIKTYLNKNNIKVHSRISAKFLDLEPEIIEMLKSNCSIKQIKQELKVHYKQVVAVANKYNLTIKNRKQAALNRILPLDEANNRLPENNGKVIGYNQEKKKYIVQSNDGFIYYKIAAKLNQGDPRNKSGTPLNLENVKKQLNDLGYEYLEGWTIKRKSLKAKHLACGEIRENKLSNFYFQDCSTCNNTGISKTEIEILEWIRSYYPNAVKYKFEERVTKPKEIDIFIPELKLGIEYCGLHWHSEKLEHSEDSKHYKKMLMAQKEGIRLITIFENEWVNRKDQVKGFLLSAIKKNSNFVYARKCSVATIDSDIANDFLEKYHIQGASPRGYVNYGLFYNNELIAVMNCGAHPQKTVKEKSVYLNRMAFKYSLTVVGGASKLLSAFIQFAKSNGFDRVVSWSDNRWTEGHVYKQLGFNFDSQKDKGRGLKDGSIWPELFYVYKGEVITRKKLKFLGLDPELLPKIYDCGKKRWILNLYKT